MKSFLLLLCLLALPTLGHAGSQGSFGVSVSVAHRAIAAPEGFKGLDDARPLAEANHRQTWMHNAKAGEVAQAYRQHWEGQGWRWVATGNEAWASDGAQGCVRVTWEGHASRALARSTTEWKPAASCQQVLRA